MRFGRVEGYVVPIPGCDDLVHLTVTLETGKGIEMVRDEDVAVLRVGDDPATLAWQADQYTQETIGVHLAELGWEAIGVSDAPTVEANAPARSATYGVRNLS